MSLRSRARDGWMWRPPLIADDMWPESHEQLTCSRGLAQLQRPRAWWSSRGLTERECE